MADQTLRQAGVYCITHVPSGLVYIGSSRNIHARWACHQSDMRNGKCRSRRLQKAYNRSGFSAFTISILESVPGFTKTQECQDQLIELEQVWIDKINPCRPSIGFNISPAASGGSGASPPPEARARMAASHRGHKHTAETLAKMSVVQKLRFAEKVWTQAEKTEWAASLNLRKGPVTPETRAKLSAASKRWTPEMHARKAAGQRNPSAETRAKLSAAQKLRPREIMEKVWAGNKGRTSSPEHRAKVSAAHKGRTLSAEWRAKLSAAAKARSAAQSPEHRLSLSVAMTAAKRKKRAAAVTRSASKQ
jgi:group I intron endonuclease